MQDPAFQLQNVLDGNATIVMDEEFLRLFAPQKCCSVLLPLSKSYSPPFFDDDDGNHNHQHHDADDEIEIVKSTVQKKETWEVTVSDIFNARGINFAYGSSKPAGTLPLPRPRA